MNTAFIAAGSQYKQQLPQLTHNQQVAKLYRHSLKVLGSWAVDRTVFIEEASKLRARFDANRNCAPDKANRFLREGKEELQEYTHPDPYRIPFMPGGSMFMRNPPLPMDVCFPDGDIPADAPKVTLNPDMSICKEETGKSAVGQVLVDFTSKSMA
uniref:NADH dehydrogenase [ubiquinone] 1 beta subcomplex subunit 9 n=1 Tax=Leptocylindrus danicus TaxID=163516 RepID=A0A7S2KZH1_9STRA